MDTRGSFHVYLMEVLNGRVFSIKTCFSTPDLGLNGLVEG